MGLTYEAAQALFHAGHYLELVKRSDTSDAALDRLDAPHALLIARALVYIDIRRAEEMARRRNQPGAPPSVRSACELVIGSACRRHGELGKAIVHYQRALQLAQQDNDTHQSAWASLHLFRLLAEVQPHDGAVAVLRDTRAWVTRSGDPHAAAFLHDSIALIEATTGRVDEARRHLKIAASLLDSHPNAWLCQMAAVSAFCVAFLSCDYAAAPRHLRAARRFLAATGAEHIGTIIECNEGHAALVTGRFGAAEARLRRAAADLPHHSTGALGGLDGLARLYLATGRLDECDGTLKQMDALLATDPTLQSGFTSRSAVVTRVRLHMRRMQWRMAYEEARAELVKATTLEDRHLMSALSCLDAEASTAAHRFNEACRSLLAAAAMAPTLPERQGDFHYSIAAVLEHADSPLARQVLTRAHAISDHQGNRAARIEHAHLGRARAHTRRSHPEATEAAGALPERLRPAAVTNALASVFDLAGSPRLLGAELVNVIRTLACSPEVGLAEGRANQRHVEPTGDQCTLPLGTQHGKRVTLVCAIPEDPVDAVVLGDVLRLGRSALELERTRREERTRAALCPVTPVEEQHGALFLAEVMRTLLDTARRIAATQVPVLITGETGTGKEVLARTIHAYSGRTAATFLPFNWAAVPKEMLDSQLFGHRKGAFTGATDHFPGVIRAASGGTLFLDEIGDLTPETQPKLLRFLESGDVHPVGELRPVHADVRVIAATNTDLDALVAEGRFRDDLFYRLNIIRLHVPPLRDRRVEIPALASHFLHRHAQECGKSDLRLAEETIEYLVLYRWPGNVRQLANEMRRLAALAEPGAILMPEHLSADIVGSRRTIPASERRLEPTEFVVRLDQPIEAAVQHVERATIQYALQLSGGQLERTAAMLGLSRKGLYLKRQRFGLDGEHDPLSRAEAV